MDFDILNFENFRSEIYRSGSNDDDSVEELPLVKAIQTRDINKVTRLLNEDDDCDLDDENVTGITPLGEECTRDLEITRLLLKRGADVNHEAAPSSMTPLTRTVTCRRQEEKIVEMVTLLLEHGADIEARDVLFQACMSPGDRSKVVLLLLQRGANRNKTYAWNQNLVCATARRTENINVLRVLLEHGVDPDRKSTPGQNALHYAVLDSPEKRNIEKVKALLDHNADITLTDDDGKTALDLACEKEYLDAIYLLVHRGLGNSTLFSATNSS